MAIRSRKNNKLQCSFLILFNGITDALDSMERMNFGRAKDILQDAQINAEEAYLSAGEEKSD